MRSRVRCVAVTSLLLLGAFGAGAVPTSVTSTDTPGCDPLAVPSLVDEIGEVPPFPPGEQLAAATYPIGTQVCATAPSDPLIVDAAVVIINFNSVAFTDVWYVADPETSFSNPDGLVNGMLAFKIDAVGVNVPLIIENGALDGIWSPGETWEFVIQDYTNLAGLPPDALSSIGVPSLELPPPSLSSGSIIAIPVPEPGTAALLALGLAALARRRARS